MPVSPAQASRACESPWHLSHLKVTEAHRISKGGGSTVAVIDTGVDPHSDLQGRLLPGTETFPNGTGDGRRDIDGHGTAMAGLVSGIAPEAKILPVRYTEKSKPAIHRHYQRQSNGQQSGRLG
ncbi:S8 family serine peptidase [Micromonospora zhanjiangensis]